MKKPTVASLVSANAETLKHMTPAQLFQWSRDNGLDSASGFSRFKKALLEIKVDYEQLRDNSRRERADALAAQCTHEITLFTDAKARCERFAICDRDGEVIWYGRFFNGEGSEQSAAELETAKKAIWLAGVVKVAVGAPAIRLNLKVDAQWLCTLSGKASVLAAKARQESIDLCMEWIPGTENPADKWTTASGFQSYKDTPPESLATPLNSEAPAQAAA